MTPEPEKPAIVPDTQPAPKLPGIFVATPCYGSFAHIAYTRGIRDIQRAAEKQGIEMVVWQAGGESHINRARNFALAEFLKTSCDYLFFIDADIGFSVDDFQKIVTFAFQTGQDVVAGAYPTKEIDWARALAAHERGLDPHREASRIVVHPLDVETSKGVVEGLGDCIEVKECGTGFMCISRKCIEAMIALHRSTIEYTHDQRRAGEEPRKMWNIFHADIRDDIFDGKPVKRWLSEDYWFCRTWRDMGGKVWLHLDVHLSHFGQYEHRGNPHEVHGGPQRGVKFKPEDGDRVREILNGSMIPQSGVTEPPLIVDHEAREGAFAICAGLQWPNVVFDLYEPDPILRTFLKENFAMYGLKGHVHDEKPSCRYATPYWKVTDGKVEVVT